MSFVFAGSEIYQETLAKALAKHFGAKLLIVESLVMPGVCSLTSPFDYLLLLTSFHFVCLFFVFVFKCILYVRI